MKTLKTASQTLKSSAFNYTEKLKDVPTKDGKKQKRKRYRSPRPQLPFQLMDDTDCTNSLTLKSTMNHGPWSVARGLQRVCGTDWTAEKIRLQQEVQNFGVHVFHVFWSNHLILKGSWFLRQVYHSQTSEKRSSCLKLLMIIQDASSNFLQRWF